MEEKTKFKRKSWSNRKRSLDNYWELIAITKFSILTTDDGTFRDKDWQERDVEEHIIYYSDFDIDCRVFYVLRDDESI